MIQGIKLKAYTATVIYLPAYSVSEDDWFFSARTDSTGGGTEEKRHH